MNTSRRVRAEAERTLGILGKLQTSRDLAKLRRQARKAPSPASFGVLAERHVALGQIDQALRIAEQGLELFPNSERLASVRLFAKKKRLTGQIRKLREDLARRPSPVAYTQLAEIYRELGDQKYFPCPLLRQLVLAGRLGDKSGRGVFEHSR